MRRACVGLLGGVLALACGKGAGPAVVEVDIVQVRPAASDVDEGGGRDGIRFVFDRAIAPPESIGRVLGGAALLIEPPWAGEVRWLDARTLAFLPAGKPTPSRAYSIRLADDLAVLPGHRLSQASRKPHRFVFDRIRLERVRFQGFEPFQPSRPIVELRASLPVDATAAQGCGFYPRSRKGDAAEVLGDRVNALIAPEPARPNDDGAGDDGAARRLRITSADPLIKATNYLLRCGADFRPAGGGEGLAKDHDERFATHGDPSVISVSPSGEREIPADRVMVKVTFATPMVHEQVRGKLRLQKDGKSLPAEFDGNWMGTEFRWSGDLEPRSRYLVVVEPGLVDKFGQSLPTRTQHALRTGDASARLVVPTGASVVERSPQGAAGKLPVSTRNLPAYDLECAAVPEAELAAVLSGPGGDGADWQTEKAAGIDWKRLGGARTQAVKPAGVRNQWQDDGLDLATLCGSGKPGVFLAELSTRHERDDEGKVRPWTRRVLANVTDLGLYAKVGRASSLVWVVSLSTGKPVAGAAIKIRDLKGGVRFTGTTNADGVALAPAATRLLAPPAGNSAEPGSGESDAEDPEFGYGVDRVIVTAAHEGDLGLLDTTWNGGLEAWNFDVQTDRSGAEQRLRGFIHSDRGLYRPGDTVHLRGLVRQIDSSGRMTVPTTRKVRLVVEDPRGTAIYDQSLTASAFGGFHADLPIDREARLGDFRVRAEVGKFTFHERFAVEEFRARTFEVIAKAPRRNVWLGRRLPFDVSASYLHGTPLRGGTLKWALRRRSHRVSFADHEDFVFQDFAGDIDAGRSWMRHEDRSFSEPVADGEVALDAKGRARVVGRDVVGGITGPQDYLLEATVEDSSGQAVTADRIVTAHKANLYLGFAASESVQKAGASFPLRLVAFDAEGARRAASVTISLTRRRYQCGDTANGYRCERKIDPAPAFTTTAAIAVSGADEASVTLAEGGEYAVKLEAKDEKGQAAVSSDLIWVIGQGDVTWNEDEGERMRIVASKARYQPGEIARLLPQASLPGGVALVTLERDGIMTHLVKPALGPGQAIELPLQTRHAPNAIASVVLLRGRTAEGPAGRPRVKVGMVNLPVAAQSRRLTVAVTTARPSYQPGEKVVARLAVVGADGKPVRAELAVAAADEGVLQILNYKTPDPWPAFYAPYRLGVGNATTWNRLVARRDPNEDGDPEGGDGGGQEAGRIRSRFVATAFWSPAVVTRADGTAEVSFSAPDNLTAFRIMAVAADPTDRFGSGEARFTVRKTLQVVPALPRFLSVGDEAEAAALIHNNGPSPVEIKVDLHAAGLAVSGPTTATVMVPAGVARRVAFPVRAETSGTARLRFHGRTSASASGDGDNDGVAIDLPVIEAAVPETIVLGEGTSNGRIDVSLASQKAALTGKGSLELTLDRTGFGRLGESLAHLVGYPYGCLEQTVSKVIPMVSLGELVGAAGALGVDKKAVDGFVRVGVARILRHQDDSGGFMLWPGTSPELHTSAYALFGLDLARAAGHEIPATVFSQGAAYLKRRLGESVSPGRNPAELAGEMGAQAFAHAVLASLGQGDAGAMARLYETRSLLGIDGSAFLLLGLTRTGNTAAAKQLVRELAGLAPKGDGPVLLQESIAGRDWYWTSNVRSTALTLRAIAAAEPGHPLVSRLADGLLGAREAGRWASTQDNVHALLALGSLARARAAVGDTKIRVRAAGRLLAERTLSSRGVVELSLPLATVGPGPLSIESDGKAPLVYSARLRVLRPLAAAASDRGFAVRREIVDADTGQPLERLKLGQVVRVRLLVRAATTQAHVALVDRLPAGLEPILTRFRPTTLPNIAGAAGPVPTETRWQYEELRDDGARVFADVMATGEATHTYLARATTAGTFAAPATSAEAMYRPSVNGRSVAGRLIIEAP